VNLNSRDAVSTLVGNSRGRHLALVGKRSLSCAALCRRFLFTEMARAMQAGRYLAV